MSKTTYKNKNVTVISNKIFSPIVAVLPFEIEGRFNSNLKSSIYEKFLEELLDSKICRVVDRQNIDKVLEEKKLESAGLIDPKMCKTLGEFLGADAIIVGKIFDIKNDKIGINFKVIETNTMELLNISYIELFKEDFSIRSHTTYDYNNGGILESERQLKNFNAYKHRVRRHIALQKSNARVNAENFKNRR